MSAKDDNVGCGVMLLGVCASLHPKKGDHHFRDGYCSMRLLVQNVDDGCSFEPPIALQGWCWNTRRVKIRSNDSTDLYHTDGELIENGTACIPLEYMSDGEERQVKFAYQSKIWYPEDVSRSVTKDGTTVVLHADNCPHSIGQITFEGTIPSERLEMMDKFMKAISQFMDGAEVTASLRDAS